jgi:hypothetical protein
MAKRATKAIVAALLMSAVGIPLATAPAHANDTGAAALFYDYVNQCNYSAEFYINANSVYVARTSAEATGWSSACSSLSGGSAVPLVQIVCTDANGQEYKSRVATGSAVTFLSGDFVSCYTRHRVSLTGLQGSYGQESQLYWTESWGFSK